MTIEVREMIGFATDIRAGDEVELGGVWERVENVRTGPAYSGVERWDPPRIPVWLTLADGRAVRVFNRLPIRRPL